MGVVLLDSVVIVAFLDASNAFHRDADAAVRAAARADTLVASVVTYAELLTGAKLGRRDELLTRGFFDELLADVLPVDRRVAERAAELRAARKGLRLPDALILASADQVADTVVTADAQWSKVKGLSCAVRVLSGAR